MTLTLTAAEWDAFVQTQAQSPPTLAKPAGHVLQSSAWANLKTSVGWSATRIVARQDRDIVAGAQLLFRPLPFGLGTIGYIPKGPLLDWSNQDLSRYLLALCDEVARANRAILLKIEPDLPDIPQAAVVLTGLGLQRSPHGVQPRRTLLVDLTPSEDELLARMKSKTRYNIRLAAKKGITVRVATKATAEADLAAFIQLMHITGARDGFGVHTAGYYRRAYELFQPGGQVELASPAHSAVTSGAVGGDADRSEGNLYENELASPAHSAVPGGDIAEDSDGSGRGQVALILAEYEGQPLASVMVFAQCGRAWYFYGASSNEERQRMPTYAVQWAAMRWAKARGCHTYDLWGVPDADEAELEAHFTTRRDGLWPVYRFKRGFGGRLTRSVGAWDRVYAPRAYRLYLWYLKRRGRTLNT